MKTLLVTALLAAFPALAAAQAQSVNSTFYTQAAQGGMAEVELGKLASQKGSSQDVRSFGEQMVSEHTKANAKLQSIAATKGVTLPKDVGAEHRATKAKLEKLSGSAFDQAYIDSQVKDHRTMASLLESEMSRGQDKEASAWAKETLPAVREHLAMAQKMATNTRASSGSSSRGSSSSGGSSGSMGGSSSSSGGSSGSMGSSSSGGGSGSMGGSSSSSGGSSSGSMSSPPGSMTSPSSGSSSSSGGSGSQAGGSTSPGSGSGTQSSGSQSSGGR